MSGGGGSPVFPDAAALSSSSEGCVNTEVNGSRPLCSTFKKPTDPRAADTLSSVWAECAVNQPNKMSISMTFTLEDPAPQRINTLNFKVGLNKKWLFNPFRSYLESYSSPI